MRDPENHLRLNQLIGAAIRDARLARGVTQEELARAFNIDRVTIARYERGSRTISAPALFQILAFLGQPLPLGRTQSTAPDSTSAAVLAPPVARLVGIFQARPDLVGTVEELLATLEVLPDT